MQETEHHEVWPAGTGKFAKPHESSEDKCSWQRCFFHKHSHLAMSCLRNPQLDREIRKKFVDDIDPAEHDEKRGAHSRHKVRCVENVERLKNPEADQDINREDSQNVRSANLQDSRAQLSYAHKERDRKNQDRKSARVDAVGDCGNNEKRQKPCASARYLPEKRRT